jgi:transposase-like protein
MKNPFRYFKTSPEIIRLAVMIYVQFPLSQRQVEDLLHERGVDNQSRNSSSVVEPIWSGVRG